MESEISEDPSKKEKISYELGARGVCEFQNGEYIPINRTMLAIQSPFFMNEFFGPSPKTIVKITNFDRDTFKTFLDCLFGVKKYTVSDALLIYPIAHEYGVKESIEKCTAVLEPIQMSENVCITLNLALFYKREDLANKVLHFITFFVGIVDLLENKTYRSLLEPSAVCKLIENIELESFVWELLYDWGKDYLKLHNRSDDVNLFLEENGILSKMKLSNFESFESIFKFLKWSNYGPLFRNDILRLMESKLMESNEKFPKRSEWVKLDVFRFKEVIGFVHPVPLFSNAILKIYKNKVFCDNPAQFYHPGIESVRCLIKKVSCDVYKNNSFDNRSRCSCTGELVDSAFMWNTLQRTEYLVGPPDHQRFTAGFGIIVPAGERIELNMMEIKYKFMADIKLRILKTSKPDKFTNADKLYFTKDIVLLKN